MAAEMPAFAEAVDRYYSARHGKLADAAIGETAWRAMAEELLTRDPPPAGLTYDPLLARLAAGMAAEQEARRKRDHRYLDRQAKAVKVLAEVEELRAAALKAGAEPEQRAWAPVEFVWEAYLFLRKRDGEGSPLPTKAEVKQYAAFIWAFADLGLLGGSCLHTFGRTAG